jgi:hypothetical protein
LHKAIENYREKTDDPEEKVGEKIDQKDEEECSCPYCEGPVEGLEEVCRSCHVELDRCDKCDKVLTKEDKKCPHCGATKVRI